MSYERADLDARVAGGEHVSPSEAQARVLAALLRIEDELAKLRAVSARELEPVPLLTPDVLASLADDAAVAPRPRRRFK